MAASDKADLGLEELSSLNVKSRYQVFEKTSEAEVERSPSTVNVKRSPSILSKLAKVVLRPRVVVTGRGTFPEDIISRRSTIRFPYPNLTSFDEEMIN
ncbi:LIM domain and actin-binding protein 1 [Homalodisca vitripennis]|nr:LIM domain and actin-binding protein 1 [Homalodisca vitripennis]